MYLRIRKLSQLWDKGSNSMYLGIRKFSQLWDKGSNSMCLRISQVLDRDGNMNRWTWTKVETKVPFQNKPTFAQR